MNSQKLLRTIFLVGFLFSLHVALTLYIHSSYLETKIPESLIGVLYIISAVISIIGLFITPRLLRKFGTRPIFGSFLAINTVMLLGMILGNSAIIISTCFVIYFSCNTLIYLSLDVLLEHWSDKAISGRIRGAYLTSMSAGYVTAPFIAGFITERIGFGALYTTSLILLVPIVILLIVVIPSHTQPHSHHQKVFAILKTFTKNTDLGKIFFVNFILQFFYAWMIIYMPIFLHDSVGLSWESIGLLFTIMLSAFVLLEYPFGKIADRFNFEKIGMGIGLAIMGITTLLVTRIPLLSFWGIALLLFSTRIGASMVEVMTESFFFKYTNNNNSGIIGFFRNTYPFAYIIAPMFATVILKFLPLWTLFIFLGSICIFTIIITTRIHNPKI